MLLMTIQEVRFIHFKIQHISNLINSILTLEENCLIGYKLDKTASLCVVKLY